jgi:hypothetical protein
MARVFISYANEDAALANDVHRWLTGDGHEVFLDHDLHDGIAVGVEWEQRLHDRLRWANAMVCIETPAYLASEWCEREVNTALNRGSRVLPVQAEAGVSHPRLKSVQRAEAATDIARARAQLAEALRQLDASGGSNWPDGRSPFPGFRWFEADMHSVFFGRNREIEQLAQQLRFLTERGGDDSVLLVVGPRSCGKSSLVRAGLLPTMATEPGWHVAPPMMPGPSPMAALVRQLVGVAGQFGLGWSLTDIRRRLDDEQLVDVVIELVSAGAAQRKKRLLLAIDQFDELITLANRDERSMFANQLSQVLSGGLIKVVGTAASSFLDEILQSPELAVLPKQIHTLEPLRRDKLRTIIEEPARWAGIDVDEQLMTEMVAEVGDDGAALPLMAFTLAELADGLRRGGRMLANRYEQLGGVRGALLYQADAACSEAMSVNGRSRAEMLKTLLRLVTVDEGGRPTRLRVRRGEFPATTVNELILLESRYMLTSHIDDGHVMIAIAHEALLSSWPPMADAIAVASRALWVRRQLERAAIDWTQNGRTPQWLWDRGQLAVAVRDTGAHVETCPRQQGLAQWGRHRVVVTDHVEVSDRVGRFLFASIRRDYWCRFCRTVLTSMLLLLAVVGVWCVVHLISGR